MPFLEAILIYQLNSYIHIYVTLRSLLSVAEMEHFPNVPSISNYGQFML
jgi:hypothetical protein